MWLSFSLISRKSKFSSLSSRLGSLKSQDCTNFTSICTSGKELVEEGQLSVHPGTDEYGFLSEKEALFSDPKRSCSSGVEDNQDYGMPESHQLLNLGLMLLYLGLSY